MRMYDIIAKKRDGKPLTNEEIQFFIDGFTSGVIPDYQASALAMAIYFQDMYIDERAELTMAMVQSGDTLDLAEIEGVKVDKHSTGGVGDTTTLILAPLVASVGVPVAKMSGRGLGHTGGTIDKLESVPGFHIDLSTEEFIRLVNENKVSVIGQTGNLTPADKKLYGLRDVTATVNSIPLIASSIMSKKIAAGADAIVLDVKTGAGAFMKEESESIELANAMVAIGNQVGRNTMAVISDMSQPLGNAIGNALEVKEAIDTLKGQGPGDLTELTLTLGSQMVMLANKADTLVEAWSMLEDSIQNGDALKKFKEFLTSQGGDESVVEDPSKLPQSTYQFELKADRSGYVHEIVADEIGHAASMLGAGRRTKDDEIDRAVGVVLAKKVGDPVDEGETILTIHSNHEDIENVKEKLKNNYHILPDPLIPPDLIHQIISE